eukprot:CAMPEP_0173378826 /NCGR_PEP_ID=MMETSP1356-20130122/1946_1 /TAXON_ID=77927 ORGANISM="Hemiselmis virescens, Strain PCC157" /NCGR_SAMPLE_ID=MMETSP1356 /ASSEMBLY_ACC=CAM_ASM_000847 /LENGTH=67 /DNA_ID=CAMNT_0014332025 /DNA_START=82 /DNA_END=285 /DNA_ORIENTATION=+
MAFGVFVVGTVVAIAYGVNREDEAFHDPLLDLSAGRGPNGEPPYMIDPLRAADIPEEDLYEGAEGDV